jgi:hypothetical protein
MFIYEAVRQVLDTDTHIRRISWPCGLSIKPTDTPNACVAYTKDKAPRRGWQPKAQDLIADDWIVTD